MYHARMSQESAIARAVEQAGGCSALARRLNESVQTVSNWVARGKAPANRCVAIEQVTGVNRRELRPDDWADYWPRTDPTPEPAVAKVA